MSKRLNQSNRPLVLAAIAGCALTAMAPGARAQSSWSAAVSDSWFNPARWTPAAIPNSLSTNVTLGLVGGYTVSMQNASASCGTLTLSNASALLNMVDNSTLTVNGAISNAGLIQVSTPGSPGNGTAFSMASPQQISGAGTLRLAATTSNGDSDSAYIYHNGSGANTLTNASGHTIAGYGRVYAGLINNGTVTADQNGKGLIMINQGKTNNAAVNATGGGFVLFRSIGLTQGAAGVCTSSNNSPIQFQGASVSGGTLNGAGTNAGIQFYGVNSADSVTLQNTAAVTDNSSVLVGAGGVVNNGTWTISTPAAPGNGTHVDASAPSVTIGGTGTLRLQATTSNGDSDSAYLYHNGNGSNILTNGPTHSIKGYGRIYAGLVNNGAVNADIPGKGLFMISIAKTNNGTMTASNGGFLQFRSVSVTGNPAAQIISTDAASPVQMVGATMSGGGFTTSGTGVFQYFGINTLSNLTVNGTHQVTDNSSAHLATNLVNNGAWKISDPAAPGNGTHLDSDQPVAISGTGTITLQGPAGGNGDSVGAYLYHNGNGGNTLTLGSGQTVNGYGRIYTNVINNGTIDANNTPNASGPTSKGLILMEQPKTNNATITSSNGGFWYIRGITLTNNGLLSSSNTSTSGGGFESCTVNGGTITNVSNQSFGTVGNVTINGSTLTPGSVIQVNDNSGLFTTGLTDNGTILVSTPAAPGNATHFDSVAPGTVLGGTGTLRLQAQASNGDSTSAYVYHNGNGANTLIHAASHSIKGYGRIYTNITNNGTLNGDVNGKGLFLIEQPKTNNATITSSNGGFWYVRAITLTNGVSGVLSSSNTGTSGGGFESCTIVGGSLTNVSNQSFGTAGVVHFDGVTVTNGSRVQINDNSSLISDAGGIINNGTILVDTIGAPGNSSFLASTSTSTVSGTGTVRLQATGFANNTAYLQGQGDAAHPLILGAGQTLTGTGRAFGNIVINGTISPDQPFGTPTSFGLIQPQSGTTVLGATSVFNCQLGSAASFDSIQGNTAVTIASGATLNVSIPNGYDPIVGTAFDVVTGSSVTGTFTNVNFPALLNKKQAFLVYGPNYVRLYVTCYANCDQSIGTPALTANDFQCFLNKFSANDPYANCDGSTANPLLTANDFQCFLNTFSQGCN